MFPKAPISWLGSQEAAHVRMAAAHGILAEALVDRIFRPFKITRDAEDQLLDLVSEGKRQSIIQRQIILSCQENEQALSSLVEQVTEDTIEKLRFLPLNRDHATVKTQLRAFFHDALSRWNKVYSSIELFGGEDLVSDDADPTIEDEMPMRTDLFSVSSPPTTNGHGVVAPQTNPEVIVMMFPRVASDETIIHHGVALWSDDPCVVATKQEIQASRRVNGARHGTGQQQQQQLTSARRRHSVSSRTS